MAKKCRSYHVRKVFISGLVYKEKINVKALENILDKIVSLCFKLNVRYTGNRNINANQLFKDRLHLVESGKTS